MEIFRDAYSVRLLAHTGKYLWADQDKKTVAQRRGKDTYGVIWRVEVVPERNAIRLKSVYDLYLGASDYAFLLGATGKKVLQSFASKADSSLEWEPAAEGKFVKLRTRGDKFLRANGGVPPYRNSVTHDVPVLASNQNVVLWEVEVVRKRDASKDSMPSSRTMSPRQSNVSSETFTPPPPSAPPAPQPQTETSDDDETPPPPRPVNVRKPRPRSTPIPQLEVETSEEDIPPLPPPPPPVSVHRPRPRAYPPPRRHHDDDDDYNFSPASSEQASPTYPPPRRRNPPASPPTESLTQSLRGTHITRRGGSESEVFNNDYSPPPRRRAARSEPEYDHSPPPRRRSEATYDQSPPPRRRPARDHDYGSSASETSSPAHVYHHRPAPVPAPPRRGRREEYEYEEAEEPARTVDDGSVRSTGGGSSRGRTSEGVRRIFYSVAEEDGEVLAQDEETYGTFMFRGQSVDELTRELQQVTGIHDDIILCMRNPLSTKLYKMRLALPQNNAPLSVVIVRSNSQFGRTFSIQSRQ